VAALEEWAPDGVDLFFDTVWGDASARVVERLKPFGRVTLAGQISGLGQPAVPPLPIADWFVLVTRSLTIQGFRAADYAADFAEARRAIADLVRAGRLHQEVHVVDGWDNAGPAYCDLLDGRTMGKLVVQVAA
jgi:NADPH-dependent curcumin reductase CurA